VLSFVWGDGNGEDWTWDSCCESEEEQVAGLERFTELRMCGV
jgi:hypothetical protein